MQITPDPHIVYYMTKDTNADLAPRQCIQKATVVQISSETDLVAVEHYNTGQLAVVKGDQLYPTPLDAFKGEQRCPTPLDAFKGMLK